MIKKEFSKPESKKSVDSEVLGDEKINQRRNNQSKKSILMIVVSIAMVGLLFISLFAVYRVLQTKNNKDTKENTSLNISEEQTDEPLTTEQINEKITNLQRDIQNNTGDKRKNYENIGLLYLEKNDYTFAILNLEKAIQGGNIQDEKAVYSGLAIAYYNADRKQDAINTYNKLVSLYDPATMSPFDKLTVDNYKATIERIQKGEPL